MHSIFLILAISLTFLWAIHRCIDYKTGEVDWEGVMHRFLPWALLALLSEVIVIELTVTRYIATFG